MSRMIHRYAKVRRVMRTPREMVSISHWGDSVLGGPQSITLSHIGRSVLSVILAVEPLITNSQYELFSVIQSEVDDLQRPADSRGDRFVRVNWGHSSEIPEDVEDPVQIMEWLDHRGIINYVCRSF